jgi:pimeloyl-ACP methyl ester carboxylesterase
MARDGVLEFERGTVGVRESGDPDGVPVLFFHGTPGSRLQLAWADDIVAAERVRLVTFDRPGYGRSAWWQFGLSDVADLAIDLADALGIGELFTAGWSGGGPFALATAARAPGRVRGVGVMSGAGPFQRVPRALDQLSAGDAEAVPFLGSDPERAAELFSRDFADLTELDSVEALRAGFAPLLSARDQRVLTDRRIAESLLADLQEACRQGPRGPAWDNVAWIGEWDIDPASVEAPVHLWYGDEDIMAPPAHGTWLAEHLPHATLTMRSGYGHFSPFEHLSEMLQELIGTAGPA